MHPSVSLIVTTYNWPEVLDKILSALNRQCVRVPFEVIIADDGSRQATRDLIQRYKEKFSYPLHHVWQPDEGFQAAKIRNKAIAKAQHDYIIFLDGDCQPLGNFVLNHIKLAEKGWFVFGNRILLNQSYHFKDLSFLSLILGRMRGDVNRLLPLIPLPLGRFRKRNPQRWKSVKTCNLAVWREDLLAVNGLDESFTGWGYEDSDLVLRLQKTGIQCKDGRFSVPVIHYWHAEHDRSQLESNEKRLAETLSKVNFRAIKGVDQYLID